MSVNYKQDENQLINIIKKHISATNNDSNIKTIIYYKPKKLSSLFIFNNIHSKNMDTSRRHNVIYQYSCIRDGCSTSPKSYLGFTTCTVFQRFIMHTQNISSIKKHLQDNHNIQKVTTNELLQDVTVLKTANDKRTLMYLEALYIKMKKPELNSQKEFSDKILKVFKH